MYFIDSTMKYKSKPVIGDPSFRRLSPAAVFGKLPILIITHSIKKIYSNFKIKWLYDHKPLLFFEVNKVWKPVLYCFIIL